MFGKKKKERELKAIQEARTKREQRIDADIGAAVLIEDPAKKILRLEEIRKVINNESWTENSIIFKKADKSFSRAVGTSAVAAVGGATAAGILTAATGGVGALVLFPIMIGGIFAGAKRADSVEKRLKAQVEDHLNKTDDQRWQVTRLMLSEVSKNVEEIAQSPLKEKVLDVPGIAAQFSVAAAHIIATEPEKAPEQDNADKKPAEEQKPAAPRRKRQKPDYKDLGGL